jgi:hypothetical protein
MASTSMFTNTAALIGHSRPTVPIRFVPLDIHLEEPLRKAQRHQRSGREESSRGLSPPCRRPTTAERGWAPTPDHASKRLEWHVGLLQRGVVHAGLEQRDRVPSRRAPGRGGRRAGAVPAGYVDHPLAQPGFEASPDLIAVESNTSAANAS